MERITGDWNEAYATRFVLAESARKVQERRIMQSVSMNPQADADRAARAHANCCHPVGHIPTRAVERGRSWFRFAGGLDPGAVSAAGGLQGCVPASAQLGRIHAVHS